MKRRIKWTPSFHAGSQKWRVIVPAKWSSSGRRGDRYFDNRTEAERFISDTLTEREVHGALAVTAEERRWLGYWKERVGPISLMPEVVAFWKHQGEHMVPISVQGAVQAFLDAVRGDYANRRTWSDVTERLTRFSSWAGDRPLHEITVTEVEQFLGKFQGWHRFGYYKRLKILHAWAKRRRHIATDFMAELPAPRTPLASPRIYAVPEFAALMTRAETSYRELRTYLILVGWCYCRTSELVKVYRQEQVLDWSEVRFEDGLIWIRPGVAKSTRRRNDERYVPITPKAAEWLKPLRQDRGSCVPMGSAKFGRLWRELHAKAGVEAIPNGLRHSCISYGIAAQPESGIALVSQWAGNSEATVRRHYRRLLRQEEGEAWFQISHAGPKAIAKAYAEKMGWMKEHPEAVIEEPEEPATAPGI
jgi:integrase